MIDLPSTFKNDLDKIQKIQNEMGKFQNLIKGTSEVAGDEEAKSLEQDYERMRERVEGLYATLNITDNFPELRGVNIQFSRNLVIARHLKTTIRTKAVESFFESDKLNRASGGREQPLGK